MNDRMDETFEEPLPRESPGLLDEDDEERVDTVERALAEARDLKAWWETADREHRESGGERGYRETFRLAASHNRPSDASFGFFDQALVRGETMHVMGNVQKQFFDRPKLPSAESVEWMRKQTREFVLRYFMRISDFSTPKSFPDDEHESPPRYLRPFAFCGDGAEEQKGFGFELAYFKKPGAEPGRFADEDKYRIVDLREIGKTYEWIVVKVDIFDFKATAAPFGPEYPHGVVPLGEESYLVLAADFVADETPAAAKDGVVGRYGLGYGFLRDLGDSVLAYGPGRFDAGFQLIDFDVKDDGEVRSRMAFVANRPRKVTNVSLDPVKWSLRLTDMLSFGMFSSMLDPMKSAYRQLPQMPGVDVADLYIKTARALSKETADRLCISKKQLEKIFLVRHFAQHYNVVSGALSTWREFPDWFDRDNLPDWVKSGRSS